uniref:Sec1-4 syntaxin-binding protein n=1 Tax=Paramecium tetraurelia TaxID=5888 RepID=Q3SEP7_PARTE|nr:Sec1-4 syntaxin-binding protein [Paramecium tetraurelia]
MDQGVSQGFSLRKICKQRLKGLFVSLIQTNPNVQNYFLIVDQKTVKVVSAYMKMAELMELGVSAVEKLELGRKPFPKLHAIYFISPTQDSIQRVLDDFKDKKNPQYGVVHLFLSNEIDQGLMQKIAQCNSLITKIASFKIVNLDFACTSDQVFTIETPEMLTKAYTSQNVQQLLKEASYKLATLLISFNKFYSFEFLYNQAENKLSEQIAKLAAARLQELLASFVKQKNEQYDNIEKEAGKITVMIIDRSYDVATPLLHDFYYQSMIYDLLDITNDIYETEVEAGGKQIKQKVIFNENDDLFNRYKYRHIIQVLEGIPVEFREFINNNTTAKVQQGQMNNLDLNQMSEIVKTLPQYNELLGKYTLHMKLIEKSWSIFENKGLKEIGEIEQGLITGIDGAGKSISTTKIQSAVATKLMSETLDEYDKLRLILLTSIGLEMSEKDRKILTDKIKVEHQQAILNLIYLGVNPQKGGQKKSKSSNRINDDLKKQAKHKLASACTELSRNTPLIETLVEGFVESNYKKPQKFDSIIINEDGAGSKGNGKSIRKGGQLARMMQNEDSDDTINYTPKLIIFVVGGISYSEIRSILSNQKITSSQITLVGSTNIVKPKDFCQGLLGMKTI